MTEEEIKKILVDSLNEIQEKSDEPLVEYTQELIPIKEIKGFCSPRGQEVIIILETKYGLNIGKEDNFLLTIGGKIHVTLGDILNYLVKLNKQTKCFP